MIWLLLQEYKHVAPYAEGTTDYLTTDRRDFSTSEEEEEEEKEDDKLLTTEPAQVLEPSHVIVTVPGVPEKNDEA